MVLADLNEFFSPPDLYETYVMRNNYAVTSIVLSYLYFVMYWGPRFMKNRKPMELTAAIRVFNTGLVLGNLFICIKTLVQAVQFFPHRCNMKQNAEVIDVLVKGMGTVAYQLLLLKILELIDTVFFVLRKKTHHVSFLHVFHHTTVVLLYWSILKYKAFGYYLIMTGVINCGVHVIMYTYYFLAALGPSMQKYLWWKKYLTSLQILQFFVILIYMSFSFVTGCEEFGTFEKLTFAAVVIVCALFLKFYIHSYTRGEILPRPVKKKNL